MRTLSLAAMLSIAPLAAHADEGCIKTAAGDIVCHSNAGALGADADAIMDRRLDAVRQAEPSAKRAPVIVPAAAEAPRPRMAAADVEEDRPAPAPAGSVYGSYGQKVFLRGGYGFADHGAPMEGAIIAAGYGRTIGGADSHLSVEAEALVSRSEETVGAVATEIETAGLFASLRYDAAPSAMVNPFASVGAGAVYQNIEVDDGVVAVSDSGVNFGYTARVGVESNLSGPVSVEAAYRYLGVIDGGAAGVHAAEIGVNYAF